jgi:hypothetical protein
MKNVTVLKVQFKDGELTFNCTDCGKSPSPSIEHQLNKFACDDVYNKKVEISAIHQCGDPDEDYE